jgi:hypothetical protein
MEIVDCGFLMVDGATLFPLPAFAGFAGRM